MSLASIFFRAAPGLIPYPDPVHGSYWSHPVQAPSINVPQETVQAANVRTQRPDSPSLRDVHRLAVGSYPLSEYLHFMSRGGVLFAEDILEVEPGLYELVIDLDKRYGLLDGANIVLILNTHRSQNPDNQHLWFRIHIKPPEGLSALASRGLNSGARVEEMSLVNAEGLFGWLQDAVRGESYAANIAYQEGEKKPLRADELVTLLSVMNTVINPFSERNPYFTAYGSLKETMKRYRLHVRNFERMASMVPRTFRFIDALHLKANSFYGAVEDGDYEGIGVDTHWKRIFKEKQWRRPLILLPDNPPVKWNLKRGALVPMLAAFRPFIDPAGRQLQWTISEPEALDIMERSMERMLMESMTDACGGGDKIGRSPLHWQRMLEIVLARSGQARKAA
jgi:hypothetical protein